MGPRKVIYTFIIGDYDDLKPPKQRTPGWDYICFTDNPGLKSRDWEIRISTRDATEVGLDNKRFAMKHMILFHKFVPEYDLSISLGGQFQIACDLDAFVERNFPRETDDMMISRHPHRDCIYDEAEVCRQFRIDEPAIIDAHVARYRAEGFPAHRGLYATGFIARRGRRPQTAAMCDLWYEELRRGSRRDQLSLNYALWKSAPLRIAELDFCAPEVTEAFVIFPHKANRTSCL